MILGCSEGRVIHYVKAGNCHAGMIVDARNGGGGDGTVGVKVFGRSELEADFFIVTSYTPDAVEGHWHWPERV